MAALHPDVAAFAATLRRLEALLRANAVAFWADQVGQCAAIVESSDAHGVRRFRGLFGGSGSLNDLMLADPSAGRSLDRLIGEAARQAEALARDAGL